MSGPFCEEVRAVDVSGLGDGGTEVERGISCVCYDEMKALCARTSVYPAANPEFDWARF